MWIIKIGYIIVTTKMSPLFSYSSMPRQEHLEAVLHIMCYLKLRHNCILEFDPFFPDIDHVIFENAIGQISMKVQWKLSHPMHYRQEGKRWIYTCLQTVIMLSTTKRSRTGFMVYMNMSLINWYSKKQSTIETSLFGTEFVAM